MVINGKMVAYYTAKDWPSSFYPEELEIKLFNSKPPLVAASGEHAFHMCKAALFRDFTMLRKIQAAPSAFKALQLGRQVRGFDEAVWRSRSSQAMIHTMQAKLNSSTDLYKKALELRGFIFIEASPRNTDWGVGLSETNDDVFNPSKWRGANRHGECWMQVLRKLGEG